MGPVRQRTIRRSASVAGIGIHSSLPARVTCRPAPPDAGIAFRRLDLPDSPEIPAAADAVVDTRRGVTLGRAGVRVRTVEHLLAAAAGLGITNLRVEVRGEELPILDGSAAPYCALLRRAGIEVQDAVLEPIRPEEPCWVAEEAASVLVVPAGCLRLTCVVPLHHPVLGPAQVADLTVEEGRFLREIAPARTWGFADEVEKLRQQGLAVGASQNNALGLGPEGYLNPPRMADEPARHKLLDLLGDLALLGRPLRAHVIAVGAGHRLHAAAVRRVLGR
ncbi:MAG: UDP-3-O-acyl-N-acetylglucosamine deacetylase [Armatimonadota bacterium]|nr:UDP-3-O-acyl-N-acetylglucosamine deacetylase [Armatimonadota bacterium]MDR7451358.1 UDP-3-O-acyl-N-acetylglucosamine deacetylase [Armatimonadota bacterium]MDR7466492.1 UDP-3-O-acyl-N-acetylglucosamine deacetylase [Armatimonadota bacterium]MDR7493214.1 UDP-3-O-acyl-N-acetylglucosamine deacetylase [Armatimonadota bacterium]MDR7499433.1 UDP-3-O-acyl-N-acetylglucosamine deacetylase [Armatimonadota bacterium]